MCCFYFKKGTIFEANVIVLPNEKVLRGLKKGKTCKYQLTLQADEIKCKEMKNDLERAETKHQANFQNETSFKKLD